jgi:hypothetical protein
MTRSSLLGAGEEGCWAPEKKVVGRRRRRLFVPAGEEGCPPLPWKKAAGYRRGITPPVEKKSARRRRPGRILPAAARARATGRLGQLTEREEEIIWAIDMYQSGYVFGTYKMYYGVRIWYMTVAYSLYRRNKKRKHPHESRARK